MTDTLFQLRAQLSERSEALDNLVVVGVDDESYTRLNRQWPWGRDVYASIIDRLTQLKPRVIGFDFVAVGNSADTQSDASLAAAIKNAGNVVLASYFGPEGVHVVPHPMFSESALALGLIDKPLEADGALRRMRPVYTAPEGKTYYSISAHAAYGHLGSHPSDQIRQEKNRLVFSYPPGPDDMIGPKTASARVDGNHSVRLSYRYRPERFSYLPVWKILEGAVDPAAVAGKVILIGTVSPIFHDIHPTPLGTMPGVMEIANEVAAIWEKDFIREPLADKEIWVFLIAALLFTILISRFSFMVQFGIFAGVAVLMITVFAILFVRANVLVEPFRPLTLLTLNFSVVASYQALKTFLDNVALQKQVSTDGLTGLYGHRFLMLKLASIFIQSATLKKEFCVAMLDADFFKKVNDTYGHEAGNQVLVAISKAMKQHVRRLDIAARFGGEEFTLVLVDSDPKGAQECLERIRKAIEAMEFNYEGKKFKVTISSGLASNRHPAVRTADDMLKLADKALYEAKTQGRNRVCIAA